MSQFKDLTGQKFNRWTVIKIFGKKGKSNEIHWECKCDCGNIGYIRTTGLLRGGSKSCGCLHKEIAQYSNRLAKGESGFNVLKARYKRSAKRRNILFELTDDELRYYFEENCVYCNELPNQKAFISDPNSSEARQYSEYLYNGIDRIDNNEGYTVVNCVTCCKICNMMKKDLSFEEFTSHINKMVKWQNQ